MGLNGNRQIVGLWISLAILGLSACGGGGGGGGSPPPPPPPPGNAAPVARAVASAASVPEGQPFSVDASTSTDPENQTLSFAWSQVSGPTVSITSPNQARLDLRAAEVTANTNAVFRVTVSDGTTPRTADASITFSNIAQTPVATSRFVQIADIAVPERPIGFFQLDFDRYFLMTEATPNGPVQVWDVAETVTASQITFTLTALLNNRIARPFVSGLTSYSQLSQGGLGFFQFLIAEETLNRVGFLALTQDGQIGGSGVTTSVSRPCGLDGTFGLSNFFVTVGSRDEGVSLVALEPSFVASSRGEVVRQFGGVNTICAHTDLSSPSTGSATFLDSSQFRQLQDFLVYNETTRQIERYTQTGSSTPQGAQYGLGQAVQPQLNTSAELRFVTGKRITAFFPRPALALLFTDDQHAGTHRLVVAGLDENRDIVQYTYSWPLGIPENLTQWNFDGDNIPNVIVIAPDSPQLIVFDTPDGQSILPLSGPRFYEIGLGAVSFDTTTLGADGRQFSVISYPDRGRVRVLEDPTP